MEEAPRARPVTVTSDELSVAVAPFVVVNAYVLEEEKFAIEKVNPVVVGVVIENVGCIPLA